MLREPRRLDHTICTAVAPEAVFTVRTWAIRAAYDPKLVPKFPLPARQNHRSQTYSMATEESLIKVRLHPFTCEIDACVETGMAFRLVAGLSR